jgi:hypothetical protein
MADPTGIYIAVGGKKIAEFQQGKSVPYSVAYKTRDVINNGLKTVQLGGP